MDGDIAKLLGNDHNFLLAVGDVSELNNTVSKSKQSVITASANVLAGVDVSSSLSDKDVACSASLSVSSLYAQTLGFGISAVLGRAHTFFMCKKL